MSQLRELVYEIMINMVSGNYGYVNPGKSSDKLIDSFEKIGLEKTIDQFIHNFNNDYEVLTLITDYTESECEEECEEIKNELFSKFVDELGISEVNSLHGEYRDEISDKFLSILGNLNNVKFGKFFKNIVKN